MPQPDERLIRDFLDALGKALGETAALPEFEEMFESGPRDPLQPVAASRDEIEAAVVMGLQRAEIAQQEVAEAKRVQAQWDIADGLGKRNDAPPPSPDAKALDIVDPGKLPDMKQLAGAAAQAVQKVVSARGEPDAEFEKATAEATDALDKRDAGIEAQKKELDAELARRRTVVKEAEQALAEARKPITGILKDTLESNKAPRSVKALGTQLKLAEQQLKGLPGLVETALPGDFSTAVGTAREAVAGIAEKVQGTTSFVQGEVQKDRKSMLEHLPKEAPKLPKDAALLGDPQLLETARTAGKSWDGASKAARAIKQTDPDERFQTLFEEAVEAYLTAQEGADAANKAAKSELDRRGEAITKHRDALGKVAAPDNLTAGTKEHGEFSTAEKSAREALGKLDKKRETLAITGFDDASTDVAKRIEAFEKAAKTAGDQATERSKRAQKLREDTLDAAKAATAGVTSALQGFAVAGVGGLVATRFKAVVDDVKNIKGIDDAADKRICDAVTKAVGNATEFKRVIEAFPAGSYGRVSDNKEVDDLVTSLKERLKVALDGEAASIAGKIGPKCDTLCKKYDDLDNLEALVTDALKKRQFASSAGKVLDGYQGVRSSKKDYNSGDLQKEINRFTKAIGDIDYAVSEHDDKADEKNRPDYDASQCKTFINDWGKAGVVGRLETLVTGGAVRVGTKLKAYQSNDDKPSRFSVEANIRIDGHTRVVLHCHCDTDGTPKSGNACHFKLSAEKYDVGVSHELSNALRTALLPPKRRCYEAGKGAGFVS